MHLDHNHLGDHHAHDHNHSHTHEHTHDGVAHSHEHCHCHEHDHAHPHDHDSLHAHGVPHDHDHGCSCGHDHDHECGCGHSCSCQHTPMDELLALMKYMANHNAAHAQELAQLAKQLHDAGEHAAYEQVMAAVSDFEKGNMRLSVVLASLASKG